MSESPGIETEGAAARGSRVGHYDLREEIGKGGMGVVFRARDLQLQRDVALKRPAPEHSSDPSFRQRFLREARATAQLSHKNIVSILEVFEHEGTPWLAMQLVDGESLRTVLSRRGILPVSEVLVYAEEIAEALEAAHERHLLHRDINPSNIIISSAGHAMVTDFGLAHYFFPPEESSTASTVTPITLPGSIVGTLPYAPPEQVLGQELNPAADLFSLGAVIYEMCAGQPAFASRTGPETLDAILHREPLPLGRLNHEVPAELDRIVHKALSKGREERYQSARDLLVDLRALRRRIEFETYPRSHPQGAAVHRLAGWRSTAAWVSGSLLAGGLVAGLLWMALRGRPVPATHDGTGLRVGILAPAALPENTGASQWPLLFQALLAGELTGVRGLGVADPVSLNGIIANSRGSGDPAQEARLYETLRGQNLRFVVNGRFLVMDSGYGIGVTVTDLGKGEVQFAAQAPVAGEADLPKAARDIALQVIHFVRAEAQDPPLDKDLETWLSLRKQNVAAVRAFMMANQCTYGNEPCSGKYLRQAVDIDPTFVGPRVWLISDLLNQGNLDEAKKQQTELLALAPSANPFEQNMIAWAGARIRNDIPAQARALESALTYSPGNNILLTNLGIARAQMHDYDGALEALSGPVEGKWRFMHLYSIWGYVAINAGRFDEAKSVMEMSLTIVNPESKTYGLLEALCIAAHKPDDALRYQKLHARERLRQGLAAEDPDLVPIYAILGSSCLKDGSIQEATRLFEKAVEINPRKAALHDNLGSARMQSGDLRGAEREYLSALECDSGWANAHLMLGKVFDARGDAQAALAHYRKYLKLEPQGRESDSVRNRLDPVRH